MSAPPYRRRTRGSNRNASASCGHSEGSAAKGKSTPIFNGSRTKPGPRGTYAGDPGFRPGEGDLGRDQRCPPDGLRQLQAEARSMIGPAHHVGIAVKSLREALEAYRRLGLEPDFTEEVPSQGVRVAFLRTGAVRVELLESLQP